MRTGSSALLPGWAPPQPLVNAWAAWRGLSRRHFLITVAIALAFGINGGVSRWFHYPKSNLLHVIAANSYETLAIAFPLLFLLALVDRASLGGVPRWILYTLAALAATAGGVAVARSTYPLYLTCACPALSFVSDFGLGFFGRSGLVLVCTFIYAYQRTAMQRLEALRAVQRERVLLARQTFESRLQAMQARVEPQFLFNTLLQVEELYEVDAARADRMLDDLIAYLRAALPQLRATTSTLAKEVELALAYLNIVKVRLQDRLSFEIETLSEASEVRAPPMVLLPLLDHAIAHGLTQTQTSGTIGVRCRVEGNRLQLTIADSGAGLLPQNGGDGIEIIRERLAGLYGNDARLVLDADGHGGTEAVMEVPYETTENSNR